MFSFTINCLFAFAVFITAVFSSYGTTDIYPIGVWESMRTSDELAGLGEFHISDPK